MEYHIVGGGPVGFAVALLFAKHGSRCVVYEGRDQLTNNIEESFPFGINPRGLATLAAIDAELVDYVRKTDLIDSWQIFAGSYKVATLFSGCVHGATRGGMNALLYETALKNELIEVKLGHKLVDVDFEHQILVFETQEGKQQIQVKADRVIGADGVNSRVRRQIAKSFPDFQTTEVPWTHQIRVLFGPKNQLDMPNLDTRHHYIFGNCYCCVVSTPDSTRQWTVAISVRDDSPEEERKLLLSNEASDENVAGLREILRRDAPLSLPFFPTDDDLKKFFSRRAFSGSIIKCSRMNHGEWVCLLGDASHSVFPITGEGFNGGLEDALVLCDLIKSKPERPFSAMNESRLPDVHAIVDYALFANEIPNWEAEKMARTGHMMLQGLAKNTGLISTEIDDYLFGRLSSQRVPYRRAVRLWKQQKFVFLNISRCICYPLYAMLAIFGWISQFFCSSKNNKKKHQ